MYLFRGVAFLGFDSPASLGPASLMAVTLGSWLVFDVYWISGAARSRSQSPEIVGGRTARLIGKASGAAALAISIECSADVWKALTDGSPYVRLAGLPILVASTAFTLWARATIGAMWNSGPALRPTGILHTTGPYALVRHPIYTGILGMLLGTGLAGGFGVWTPLSAFAAASYFARIRKEERLLASAFPEQHTDYRARVPCVVPSLRPRNRPSNRGGSTELR